MSHAGLTAMLSMARSDPAVAVHHQQLDRYPWLLVCQNGVIDLQKGSLSKAGRELLMTKRTDIPWNPSAGCPTWERFLLECMGYNDALVGFLRRFVGYSLTGMTCEHAMVFNYGAGANGKSTFLNVLRRLLGEYATALPRSVLRKHHGVEPHPADLALLYGMRVATVSELGEDETLDDARIKELVSDDAIVARRMRENFWEFQPTHKLWVAGNHKPEVRGTDDGVWRRIRLVPWTVVVPPERRDRSLLSRLFAELPGILAWAVRGCLEWQKVGLGEPVEVLEATAAYRVESDPLAAWIDACCVLDAEGLTPRKFLRRSYEEWCKDEGIKYPVSPRKFAECLKRKGVVDGGNHRFPSTGMQAVDTWRGIRLKDEGGA